MPVTEFTTLEESMNEIRKLQENPELGEWRIHAALKDLGIKLFPRACGRMLALNRSLYGLKGPKHGSWPCLYESNIGEVFSGH
jgi:hypothetical protein